MAATNAVLIYQIIGLIPRRVVLCDNDAQATAPNGPCKLNAGEAGMLIPMTTYNTFTSPADFVTAVNTVGIYAALVLG